ncbi:MAG: hypothetical protein K0Q68_163 [Moraxellaceae bacterium]|jgi:hyperosmotically inducible protein|nr:hypothetical protein [Moraxellaceae bacterium]
MTAPRLAVLLILASTATSPAPAASLHGSALDSQASAATPVTPTDAHATPPAPAGAATRPVQADAAAPGTSLAPATGSSDFPAATLPPAPPGLVSPIQAAPVLAERHTLPSRGAGAASDDSVIVAEIKSRIAGDPRMESTDIRVDSVNGTVVLTGSTSSDEARQAAEEIALQVEGVTRVENRLSSPSTANPIQERGEETLERTGRIASDSWITTKVRSSLLADPITKGMNIGVKTMEGVVSLSGQVDTQAEYDRALQLASGIKGVKRVNAAELKIIQAQQ